MDSGVRYAHKSRTNFEITFLDVFNTHSQCKQFWTCSCTESALLSAICLNDMVAILLWAQLHGMAIKLAGALPLLDKKNARLVNIFVPQLWARMLAGVHVCSITSTHGAHTLMASVQMRWNTSWLLWCTCLWHRSKQNGFWRMRLQLTSHSCLLGEFSYLLLAMILDICMGKDCAPTRSAKSKVISVWRASPQSKQNTWIFRARRQEKRPSYLLALRGAWLCL